MLEENETCDAETVIVSGGLVARNEWPNDDVKQSVYLWHIGFRFDALVHNALIRISYCHPLLLN